ncbi:hypothetical protein [Thermofilum pendens]|uniref:Uncharacterized protein n=1 Tax=Thermofilum pendens (strain DSM 2475 / Hrk 5) TaxID=368408 RepID=A1RX01_THEPD|nr:hypothetical protein [Thermofilum pendens]ABL77731.1 hypothetical protein Tpen_0322 [Thermofilum pendens Hrk 5]
MVGENVMGDEEVERKVREETWRRAALSLYATRTEDKRKARGGRKGRVHYRGLFDTVSTINWDFTRFVAHALTVVPDDVYPRFGKLFDYDLRQYLLLGDDNRPREGSAVVELRDRLQAIVDATEDGLRAEKKGKVWHVYIPRENWHVIAHKPTYDWIVHVPLEGFWTETSFPEVLARTSPDVLRSLQRGWILTDVTPPHGRYSDIKFGTTQSWQLPSTLATFPSDHVDIGVTAGILGSTGLSIKWEVSIHGYADELGWASGLVGATKRAEFRALVERCKELNGDSVALATAFLGDGELEFFLRLRWLYFKVGQEHIYLPAESAIANARAAVERAWEYVAFVGKVTRCAKIRHWLYVAYGAPGRRGRKPGQNGQRLDLYAPVAGALLNLVLIGHGDYARIYARMPVDGAPPGWYERVVEEGWVVRVVRNAGMLYYQVPQDSLFEHAAEDATLWEALYRFAAAKAQAKPAAKKLVEELLKIRLAGAQE